MLFFKIQFNEVDLTERQQMVQLIEGKNLKYVITMFFMLFIVSNIIISRDAIYHY